MRWQHPSGPQNVRAHESPESLRLRVPALDLVVCRPFPTERSRSRGDYGLRTGAFALRRVPRCVPKYVWKIRAQPTKGPPRVSIQRGGCPPSCSAKRNRRREHLHPYKRAPTRDSSGFRSTRRLRNKGLCQLRDCSRPLGAILRECRQVLKTGHYTQNPSMSVIEIFQQSTSKPLHLFAFHGEESLYAPLQFWPCPCDKLIPRRLLCT